MIRLELTAAQAEALGAALGGGAPTLWLVDADRRRIRYAEDWSAVETMPLGTRGLVTSSVHEPHADTLLVRLPDLGDGAAVFGTGRHPATRLAARMLEEGLRPGDEVIDVGTGSGILAVFAVRLGASHVRALDNSPPAIEAASRTVALNGCRDQIDLVLGELSPEDPAADLVVANILAGVLLELLPTLVTTTRAGGHLVTSGVVDARADEITEAASGVGLRQCRSLSHDGWTAAAYRRL